MSAYLFIRTRVSDPEQYQKYVEAARRLADTYGSRYVVRSRPVEILEGSPDAWSDYLLLVSEFPSLDMARAFWTSAEYADVRRLRAGAGDVHVVLAEPLPSPPAPADPATGGTIHYVNTDLDLVSSEDLTPLAEHLGSRGLFTLHVEPRDDGQWYATLETGTEHDEPASNIAAMVAVLESLVDPHRALWRRCTRREFNIGYGCGAEPWAFHQGLSSELLSRVAAVGASLRLTLYPDRP